MSLCGDGSVEPPIRTGYLSHIRIWIVRIQQMFYKGKLGATKVIVMYRSQFSYGTSEFSNRDGPERERVGDGSVGATDTSKFRCSGLSG